MSERKVYVVLEEDEFTAESWVVAVCSSLENAKEWYQREPPLIGREYVYEIWNVT